jgi:hypothetical protein
VTTSHSSLTAWPPDAGALHVIGLIDARYPLTGATMWLPHGFALASQVIALFVAEFEARGFERVALPAIVPEAALERQHRGGLGDFRGRVYYASSPWLGGDMVLAPTIEGQISSIWADWLRHGIATPPFRMWCVRSIARYEPNVPRPLWNERFVWPFIEAQTGTLSTVDEDIAALMAGSERVCASAALPVIQVERVRRPGSSPGYARRRLELVTLMPSGAVTSLSSVYDLGTRFSEAFDVSVGGRYLQMVNFACSSRLVLAIVGQSLAADGMPAYHPRIAPVQVAVIAGRREHSDRATAIAATLGDVGIRARTCAGPGGVARQVSWAMRHGAPVLLHTTSSGVTLHVRTRGSEQEVPLGDGDPGGEEIRDVLRSLAAAQERRCGAAVASMVSPDGAAATGMISRARLCGADRCLEGLLDHASLDVIGRSWPTESSTSDSVGECFICRREASQRVLVGRKAAGEK